MCAAPSGCPDVCGDVGGGCDAYCAPRSDPCHVPANLNPCSPGGGDCCPCTTNDFSSCCYQQPARTMPIRPRGCIFRSSAPLDTDTIYKRSFYGNCGDCYRSKPIVPCGHIGRSNAPLETCTVQKLSYLPPCNAGRTQSIRPPDNGLRFCGPLYAMTSQKHDYVPKCCSKRAPIIPPSGICMPCAPLECCTINKLSYMPVDVCRNPPPKAVVPAGHIVCSGGPMERCTVQKLSYLPVCLPKKEPMPWADKVRCIPPRYENLCTTYNLSYMPNCNAGRTQPALPVSGLRFFGSERSDGNTVYKLSYLPVDARCCRPKPIVPSGGICLPSGPMENCTVHKLSYQPNCCAPRTALIRPRENGLKPCGPLYDMTTQKHDFVPKPNCRRAPLVPPSLICRSTGPMDCCTINKLSYMPVNVCEYRRPSPVLPRPGVCSSQGPVEKCTTYKLSYMPNCVQPRQTPPWANKTAYVKPCAPIEKCTIQKLSYGPPGTFSRCGPGCCQGNTCGSSFPTAGIC